MFSAQPALLPAGLAAAEAGAVLQDGRQPASNSWASPDIGKETAQQRLADTARQGQ